MAAFLSALPWISDGIAASEANAVEVLQELGALKEKRLFQVLKRKTWIQDVLTQDELRILKDLTDLAGKYDARGDEAAALRISKMPFLDTIEASRCHRDGYIAPLALRRRPQSIA